MRKKRRAFTLVELIIVIIIIAIMGSVIGGIIRSVAETLTYACNYMRAVTIADEILDTIIEGDQEVPGIRFATHIIGVRYVDGGYTYPGGTYDTDSDGISYLVGWPAKNDMRVVDIRAHGIEFNTSTNADGVVSRDIKRCKIQRRVTPIGPGVGTLWQAPPNTWDGDYEYIPYYDSDASVEFSIGLPDWRYGTANTLQGAMFDRSEVFPQRYSASLAVPIMVTVGNATYRVSRRVAVRLNPLSLNEP